jgi:hypothetical protein
MLKMTSKKAIALGCLAVGLVAGAAAAQVAQTILRVEYLNTSLFLVNANETTLFSVSLDDRADAPPAGVLLQLIDASGAVVASQNVVLQPGASTTMTYSNPGSLRAHAQLVAGRATAFTDRRRVSGSVEIVDKLTGTVRPTCNVNPTGLPPGR